MALGVAMSYFLSIWCESILFGVYTVLAGGALWLLIRRRRDAQMNSLSKWAMIVLTILMYSLSTVHLALVLRMDVIGFFDEHAIEGNLSIFDDQTNPLNYLQNGVGMWNCLLGDAIVAWRAWVIWGRDWRVLVFPVICVVGGFVASAGTVQALATAPQNSQVYSTSIYVWFGLFGILSAISNVHAVLVISYKAWRHHRELKQAGLNVSGKRTIGVFLVFIESGMVYCAFLLATVIIFLGDSNGVNVAGNMLTSLTGIYPTIIIVLVCLKMTTHDDMTRNTTIAFRSNVTSSTGGAFTTRPTVSGFHVDLPKSGAETTVAPNSGGTVSFGSGTKSGWRSTTTKSTGEDLMMAPLDVSEV